MSERGVDPNILVRFVKEHNLSVGARISAIRHIGTTNAQRVYATYLGEYWFQDERTRKKFRTLCGWTSVAGPTPPGAVAKTLAVVEQETTSETDDEFAFKPRKNFSMKSFITEHGLVEGDRISLLTYRGYPEERTVFAKYLGGEKFIDEETQKCFKNLKEWSQKIKVPLKRIRSWDVVVVPPILEDFGVSDDSSETAEWKAHQRMIFSEPIWAGTSMAQILADYVMQTPIVHQLHEANDACGTSPPVEPEAWLPLVDDEPNDAFVATPLALVEPEVLLPYDALSPVPAPPNTDDPVLPYNTSTVDVTLLPPKKRARFSQPACDLTYESNQPLFSATLDCIPSGDIVQLMLAPAEFEIAEPGWYMTATRRFAKLPPFTPTRTVSDWRALGLLLPGDELRSELRCRDCEPEGHYLYHMDELKPTWSLYDHLRENYDSGDEDDFVRPPVSTLLFTRNGITLPFERAYEKFCI